MTDDQKGARPVMVAQVGDQLVLYHYWTRGTKGFTYAPVREEGRLWATIKQVGFWRAMLDAIKVTIKPFTDWRWHELTPIVTIRLGLWLEISGISPKIRRKFQLGDAEKFRMRFTQITCEDPGRRDALRFPSGVTILLHELNEGLRATVLASAGDTHMPTLTRRAVEMVSPEIDYSRTPRDLSGVVAPGSTPDPASEHTKDFFTGLE